MHRFFPTAFPLLLTALWLSLATPACAQTAASGAQASLKPAPLKHAPVCTDDSGWDDPATPRKIFGNTWYVGTCGITALLITAPGGHVLIDGGTEVGGKLIEANIRALGFSLRDVHHILISHDHHDHVGGLAHLQRVTGAKVYALSPSDAVLRTGKHTRQDPQFLDAKPMSPIANVHALKDGQVLQAGLLKLTVHATPGHTPGGSSWTWQSCEGKVCRQFAYLDSLTAISDDVFRYSDDLAHPAYLATFKQALKKIAALPCDVLITPHPKSSGLWERFGPTATKSLVDPQGCRDYAENGMAGLEKRLAKER